MQLRATRLTAIASAVKRAFNIRSLFAGSVPGVWYDPSDLTTLFQDSAGTTPVTAVEQPVGLMLDKSQGLVASTKGGQMVGVSGSGFDTPSATANQITGDIDIRVQASLVSWTPAAVAVLCSRVLTGTTSADSYEVWINTSGVLQFQTVSGTTNTNVSSSAAVGFAAGTTNWVRVTWQQSSGFVNFFTSSDGVTWAQNGTANRAGTTAATNAGSRILRVGARMEGSFPVNGTIYRAQIYNGINGTLAVDFNPTLYTSGATLTAATGEVWTITGSNARIVPNGNHAFQATSSSRPVLSARYNLLTKTEHIDAAAWVKVSNSVTANAAVAPNGTTTADELIPANGTSALWYTQQITTSTVAPFAFSLYAKANTAQHIGIGTDGGIRAGVDLSSGTVSLQAPGFTATATPSGNGWHLITFTGATADRIRIFPSLVAVTASNQAVTGNGTSGIYIWGASLVPANQSTLPYQRVNTSTDYATTGFLPYLRFDGVDDSLSTNSISFTATDKMSVFAGVRKLSDAATAILCELSLNAGTNSGAFYMSAPNDSSNQRYGFYSKGTATLDPSQGSYVTGTGSAPDTAVLTGLSNIVGDSTVIRRNGTAFPAGAGDQGAGNYGNYPLYIGRRNNASLPFNGQMYSMIIVGKSVTAGELSNTEKFVASKTGVTL